jgi:hypothetical protein
MKLGIKVIVLVGITTPKLLITYNIDKNMEEARNRQAGATQAPLTFVYPKMFCKMYMRQT